MSKGFRFPNRKLGKESRENLQKLIGLDIKDKEKYEKAARGVGRLDINLLKQGMEWYQSGLSLNDAPENLRNNKSFVSGYEREKRVQSVKIELYNLGGQKFLDGCSLEEVPDIYKNNQDFINGYNDMKYQSENRSERR